LRAFLWMNVNGYRKPIGLHSGNLKLRCLALFE
jgi:hypothetical protein